MSTTDKMTEYGRQVQHRIKELKAEPYVKVGIQGVLADASKKTDEGTEDITLVEVAVINEFGTADGRIPERSFIRATHDLNQDAWRKFSKKLFDRVIEGKMTTREAMTAMGTKIQNAIKSRIKQGITPYNALSTIKAKSRAGKWGNVPLVDTGQLIAGVTHVVKNVD